MSVSGHVDIKAFVNKNFQQLYMWLMTNILYQVNKTIMKTDYRISLNIL